MDTKTNLKNGRFWGRFWATLDERKVAFYLDGKAFGVNPPVDNRGATCLTYEREARVK